MANTDYRITDRAWHFNRAYEWTTASRMDMAVQCNHGSATRHKPHPLQHTLGPVASSSAARGMFLHSLSYQPTVEPPQPFAPLQRTLGTHRRLLSPRFVLAQTKLPQLPTHLRAIIAPPAPCIMYLGTHRRLLRHALQPVVAGVHGHTRHVATLGRK